MRVTKRTGKLGIVLFAVIVVLVLAGISYSTTSRITHASWASGEWILLVRDEEGRAVPNPTVDVLLRGSEDLALDFLQNGKARAAGDENGRIVCKYASFSETVYTRWRLFWIVPITNKGHPSFDLRFSAPGYETKRIPMFLEISLHQRESTITLSKRE